MPSYTQQNFVFRGGGSAWGSDQSLGMSLYYAFFVSILEPSSSPADKGKRASFTIHECKLDAHHLCRSFMCNLLHATHYNVCAIIAGFPTWCKNIHGCYIFASWIFSITLESLQLFISYFSNGSFFPRALRFMPLFHTPNAKYICNLWNMECTVTNV